jgi:AmiR/NasT family two-component response regulator
MAGQAAGMTMERYRLSADAAFDVVRRLSIERNRTFYELPRM